MDSESVSVGPSIFPGCNKKLTLKECYYIDIDKEGSKYITSQVITIRRYCGEGVRRCLECCRLHGWLW